MAEKMQFYIHNMNGDGVTPQYSERIDRRGWIKWGDDNLFPDYLISLQNRSAKHNAILSRKAKMIAGNGFILDGLDPVAINFIANPYNEENLATIAYKMAYDLEVFGSFSLEIIYSKDKKRISEINFVPVNKIRLGEDEKHLYYSNDWRNIRKFSPIEKPKLDLRNPIKSQILYVKEYKPGIEYYGQANYLSAANWIELEYEISLFHLNQVKNGFHPSLVVNFSTGVPTEDEMEDVIRQLRNDFEGASQAGKVMFLFSDGKDRAAEITPIQLNDSDERFIQLNTEITQGILTGHQVVNPAAFGVSTPGALGEKSVIVESIELFQGLYIDSRMKLIEDCLNKLLAFNGSRTPLKLKEYDLNIKKIEEGNE
jgi:hypothetical protein